VSCGHGFTLKGVKKPDLDVTAEPARSCTPQESAKQRLLNLIELYDGEDDQTYRRTYGVAGRTWQSKCGQYRIREQHTFMGVNMEEYYSKCVHLLKRERDKWEPVRPKGKFRTVLATIKRMVKDSNGQKAKATTRAEKLDIRVAQITNRKSSYA
jgi:hypothetical protein